MKKKRILVTGANGYLGQGIVKELLEAGKDVIATDFNIEGIDSRAKKVACNLFEVEDIEKTFFEPDTVLHLAWRDGFKHYSEAHIKDLPLHFEFIKKCTSSSIEKIAIMGSMHEVGFYEGCINADTPCNPTTPYGISKNALRNLAKMTANQSDKLFQWLRGFYIVGTEKNGSSIFSKIVQAVDRGDKTFPFTMGLNQFDFIEYEVFCKEVAEAVSQDELNGIINICSGYPEKLSDRVERFIKENDYDIRLDYGAFPDRPYDSKAVWGDAKLIEQIMKK